MRRLALIALAALLWSCQQQTNDTSAAPPSTALPDSPLPDGGASTVLPPANDTDTTTPAPTKTGAPSPAADFHGPLRAIGTEPFWAVRIGDKLTVQRPGVPDLVLANAGPTINGDVAVWNARDLTVRLEAHPGCSDGMSDNVYPYAATVTLEGQVLKGCAAREDQWPREGEG